MGTPRISFFLFSINYFQIYSIPKIIPLLISSITKDIEIKSCLHIYMPEIID